MRNARNGADAAQRAGRGELFEQMRVRGGLFRQLYSSFCMKILLVEDDVESRRNLKRLIERRGHEVVAVGSAEEAQAELRAHDFPFLILDWMLPGMSGVELCRRVRAEERGDELFIVLATARADTADLEQALAAGANDYLTKPLDLGLLNVRLSVAERQIRDLSERNQARAALQESATTMTNILENTTDGYFAVDRDWKFTYVNPEAEILLDTGMAKFSTGAWSTTAPDLEIFDTTFVNGAFSSRKRHLQLNRFLMHCRQKWIMMSLSAPRQKAVGEEWRR